MGPTGIQAIRLMGFTMPYSSSTVGRVFLIFLRLRLVILPKMLCQLNLLSPSFFN